MKGEERRIQKTELRIQNLKLSEPRRALPVVMGHCRAIPWSWRASLGRRSLAEASRKGTREVRGGVDLTQIPKLGNRPRPYSRARARFTWVSAPRKEPIFLAIILFR